MRYAFAVGRRSVNTTLLQVASNPRMAIEAMRPAVDATEEALRRVLPGALAATVVAGGKASAKMLKRQLRAAGGPGSGNFGHAGRPGEVGGSSKGTLGLHGTALESVNSIMRDGLLPDQFDRVWMTESYKEAMIFAEMAPIDGVYPKRHLPVEGGNGAILEIRIPESEVGGIEDIISMPAQPERGLYTRPTLDDYNRLTFKGRIPPEWIKLHSLRIHGRWVKQPAGTNLIPRTLEGGKTIYAFVAFAEGRWAAHFRNCGAAFTDRYQALGIPYPDPKTVCRDQCEGTGWIPVYLAEGDTRNLGELATRIRVVDEDNDALVAAWREAEKTNPCEDGWHFVKCPSCNGSGLRNAEAIAVFRNAGGPGSGNFGHAGRPGAVGGSSRGTGYSNLLRDISKPDGGFSYNPITRTSPTSGYMVSIHKGRELVLDTKAVNGVTLATYVRDNADLLRQSNNYLGAWHNPENDKVYLDVSRHTESRAEAEALGKKHNQEAFFDLVNGKSVDLKPNEEAYGRAAEEAFTEAGWFGRGLADPVGDGATDEGSHGHDANGSGDGRDDEDPFRSAGGPGSGHFGHAGRPGYVGGSQAKADDAGSGSRSGTPVSTRPTPNVAAQGVANDYARQYGFAPIKHDTYHTVNEQQAGSIADAYDALPVDDSSNPAVIEAYESLAKEVDAQYAFAVERGMQFIPWTSEGQPYATSKEMADDVRDNNRLYFFTGGEPHPFLSKVDAATGLTYNDKFRAIHDYFGHAAGGYGFGARGEENAWAIHSQMFSEPARKAMTTETRGQNSWVNFGRQNYDAQGNYLNIPAADRPFATQKVALLPERYIRALALRTADDFFPPIIKKKKPFTYRFDETNPDILEWAEAHAGELIKGITKTTRERINNAVVEALDGGSIRDAISDIVAQIGDNDRAELIARTETMRAANEGQRQSWQQAVDEDLLPPNVRREWIATADTNVCPLCEELNGKRTTLDGEYPDPGGDGPPLHPNCRCTEGIVG